MSALALPLPAGLRSTRRRGLTLVELLVSGVLLGTVLVVLIQGVMLATRVSSQAHHEAVALQLAESLLADLRTGQKAIGEDDSGDFEEEGFSDYSWQITAEPLEELSRMTVTIRWMTGYGERTLDVTGLFLLPVEDEEENP